MTYAQLIRSSLRLIGQLGPGRTEGASELADAQLIFNAFLDSCNVEGLNLYTRSSAIYTAIPQQSPITIGPGGNWNADRPQKITAANLLLQTSPIALRRPMNLLTDEEWAQKRILQVYTMPADLYNDGAWPLSNLYFYPIPDVAYQIELYTWQLLHQVSNFNTTADFPPGYLDFLRYNFALRLAPEWGKPIRPDVLEQARLTKARLQSMNVTIPNLYTDVELRARRSGAFDYLSRETGR